MEITKQVRFCGLAGQGVLLAGNLFAHAALEEWKYVCETSAYGTSVTGGLCSADVVFSQSPISYPRVIKAQVLIAMAQGSYNIHINNVENGAIVIYDQGVTKKDMPGVTQIYIPASRMAAEDLKTTSVANMIILGMLVKATGMINKETLLKTIEANVSRKFQKLNFAAIDMGFNYKVG